MPETLCTRGTRAALQWLTPPPRLPPRARPLGPLAHKGLVVLEFSHFYVPGEGHGLSVATAVGPAVLVHRGTAVPPQLADLESSGSTSRNLLERQWEELVAALLRARAWRPWTYVRVVLGAAVLPVALIWDITSITFLASFLSFLAVAWVDDVLLRRAVTAVVKEREASWAARGLILKYASRVVEKWRQSPWGSEVTKQTEHWVQIDALTTHKEQQQQTRCSAPLVQHAREDDTAFQIVHGGKDGFAV